MLIDGENAPEQLKNLDEHLSKKFGELGIDAESALWQKVAKDTYVVSYPINHPTITLDDISMIYATIDQHGKIDYKDFRIGNEDSNRLSIIFFITF
ncbi:MAG: hypothetical protein ACTSR0_04160 [Candidatus Asgardarchaeia archaeon]